MNTTNANQEVNSSIWMRPKEVSEMTPDERFALMFGKQTEPPMVAVNVPSNAVEPWQAVKDMLDYNGFDLGIDEERIRWSKEAATAAIQAHAAQHPGIPSEEERHKLWQEKWSGPTTPESCAKALRDHLLSAFSAQTSRLEEENAILQSQVDNADATWQQQKLCTDAVRKEKDELTARVKELEGELQEHHILAADARKMLDNGGAGPNASLLAAADVILRKLAGLPAPKLASQEVPQDTHRISRLLAEARSEVADLKAKLEAAEKMAADLNDMHDKACANFREVKLRAEKAEQQYASISEANGILYRDHANALHKCERLESEIAGHKLRAEKAEAELAAYLEGNTCIFKIDDIERARCTLEQLPFLARTFEERNAFLRRGKELESQLEQVTRELERVRPIADAYQGVCRMNGVESDLGGLIADLRASLAQAQQLAGRWVPVSERPTEKDATKGYVFILLNTGFFGTQWWNLVARDPTITHWLRIPPLPTPEPESERDIQELFRRHMEAAWKSGEYRKEDCDYFAGILKSCVEMQARAGEEGV